MTIIPAILSDSSDLIRSQLQRVKEETQLQRVQIDIVDPDFADDLTLHPIDLSELNFDGFKIDIHLMTNDPINDVIECAQIRGINSIIAQIEHMGSQEAFIEHVHSYKLKAGLALDIYTPIESLDQHLLSKTDYIQVMGVKVGAQGRPFAGEAIYEKLRELKIKIRENNQIKLLVDGGISPKTIAECVRAGADDFIVGSYLWKSSNLQTALDQLTLSQ